MRRAGFERAADVFGVDVFDVLGGEGRARAVPRQQADARAERVAGRQRTHAAAIHAQPHNGQLRRVPQHAAVRGKGGGFTVKRGGFTVKRGGFAVKRGGFA
eukprot:9448422-Pyramimonas_sp.AAC.2